VNRSMKPLSAFAPAVDAESFVLAGGRSSRMGRDKALAPVYGRPLVVLALDKLRALPFSPAAAPCIAGSRPDLAGYAPIIEDIHPGCGPMGGIEAALSATRRELNVFLPVDLPLLPAEFLAWMLLRASTTGALATFPRVNGRPQPLCAIYHKDLLGPIKRALEAGERKVTSILTAALSELAGADPQVIDTFDAELLTATYSELLACSPLPVYRWFQNCNTPEDLKELERSLF
jgi:molybdenum cofactor guanylyltransferase